MHPCKSIISSFPHKSIWLCENIIPCFLACLVLQVPKSVAMKGKYSVQVIQDLDLPRHDAATIGQLSRSRIVSKAGRGAPEPSCPNCWLSAVVSGPSTETRNLYRSSGNHLTSFSPGNHALLQKSNQTPLRSFSVADKKLLFSYAPDWCVSPEVLCLGIIFKGDRPIRTRYSLVYLLP